MLFPASSGSVATVRGIAAMLVSMLFFAINDTLIKLAAERLPASEIMVIRGIFATVLVGLAVWAWHGVGHVRALRQKPMLVRGMCEALTAFLYITALAHIGLAEIIAIMQATPLIMTALSFPLLGIKVSWRNWAAVFIGFIGVLAIVQPSPAGFNLMALLALGAATAVAFRDFATQRIGTTVPALVITLGATLFSFGCGIALAPFQHWHMPNLQDWCMLGMAAVAITIGNLGVVVAFQGTDMTVVSPFRYTVVLWALLLGMMVWNDVPGFLELTGTCLIVGSGIYTLHHTTRIRRANAGL